MSSADTSKNNAAPGDELRRQLAATLGLGADALETELAARSDYLAALADRGVCDPAAVANALTRYPSLPEGAPA